MTEMIKMIDFAKKIYCKIILLEISVLSFWNFNIYTPLGNRLKSNLFEVPVTFAEYTTPVSYTHLDVYKRQVLR